MSNGFTQRDFGVSNNEIERFSSHWGAVHGLVAGGKYKHIYSKTELSSGDNDVYTVPSGKKFVLHNAVRINPTGGAITFSHNIRRNEANFRVTVANNTSVAANTTNSLSALSFNTVVLEAGESVRVTVNNTGAYSLIQGIEFDADIPITTHWIDNVTDSETTIYEVPTGKIAYPVLANGVNLPSGIGGLGTILLANNGGGTPTVSVKFIPNGEVLAAHNFTGSASPTDNATATIAGNIPNILYEGDIISVISTIATAGTHGRITILEVDA